MSNVTYYKINEDTVRKQDKSGVTAYGKASDADAGIEYFLEQEKKKSLYNVVRIKRKR